MNVADRLRRFWYNPVHGKEFRERFRTVKTMWVILIYLFLTGGILLGFMFLDMRYQTVFMPGESRQFFQVFSALQLVLIGFITPGILAGSISGERERQTLDILLTTHLTPFSIVMSKLISSLSFVGLLLCLSLPLYSFIFLFGGISPLEVSKIFLFFLVNIVFFGCLGLFCSTWMKRTGRSTVVAYGITFFLAIGTGIMFIFAGEFISGSRRFGFASNHFFWR